MSYGISKQAVFGNILKAIKGNPLKGKAFAAAKATASAAGKAPKHKYKDGVVVKDYKDLVRKLRHSGGNTLPGGKTPEQVADNIMHSKGGLITDFIPGLLGKKVGNKVKKHYGKFQRKLTDVDIKAGNKIHSALKDGKGGLRDKVSRSFLYKHNIPVKESTGVTPEKLIGVHVPGVGAPIERAKKSALPLIGSFTVGSTLADMATKKKEGKGGEKMQKTQSRRCELIEKISGIMGVSQDVLEVQSTSVETPGLASTASKMLKFAATEYRRLLDENERLACENKRLLHADKQRGKYENATKLAELMNEKSMIKKADVSAQIEKIAELDEAGYGMLKSAVENISSEVIGQEGIDKLTFLDSGININTSDGKTTMADAFGENL